MQTFDVRAKYQGGFTTKRDRTDYITIHHAAAHYKQPTGIGDVEAVRKWHMEQGHKWPGIGYHIALAEFVQGGPIARYDLSDLDLQRAHVWGQNHAALGVACLTDFGDTMPAPKWLDALADVIPGLLVRYPAALVVGHKDIAKPGHETSCPGAKWPEWKPRILEANWKRLWGPQPYHHEFGIPTKWREEYRAGRHLGVAITGESLLIDGRIVVIFEQGAIVWSPAKVEVWR